MLWSRYNLGEIPGLRIMTQFLRHWTLSQREERHMAMRDQIKYTTRESGVKYNNHECVNITYIR